MRANFSSFQDVLLPQPKFYLSPALLLCFALLLQNFLLCGGNNYRNYYSSSISENKTQKQLERTHSVLGSLLTRDVLLFAKLLRSYLIKEPAGLYFPSTCHEIPLPCFHTLRRRFEQRSKNFFQKFTSS